MIDGSLLIVAGKPLDVVSHTSGNMRIQMSTNSPGTYVRAELSTIDPNTAEIAVWAALYEGVYTADTLPPYVPKGYAAELAECQRYYYTTGSPCHISGIVTSSGKSIYLNPIFPTNEMRAKNPALYYDGAIIIRTVSGYSTAEGFTTLNGGNVSLLADFYFSDAGGICMKFNDNASSVNNSTVCVQFLKSIGFSADL